MSRLVKKWGCLLLGISLMSGTLSACSQVPEGSQKERKTDAESISEKKEDGDNEHQAQTGGIYDGIEPLKTVTDLNFGYLTGSHHGMILYMIEKMGGYEKAGINANIEVFGNGPVMVEAMASDSWDCGTIGLGGVLTGVISQDMLVVGAAARDYDSLRILRRRNRILWRQEILLRIIPVSMGHGKPGRGKKF